MPVRLITAAVLTLLVVGCPEETPVRDDDTALSDDDTTEPNDDQDGDGFTPDDGDCNDHDPSVHPGAEEACDGADNDCDGLTDEDSLDSDGDGIADCLDDECAVEEVEAAAVEIVPNCAWSGTATAANPWDIVEEWRYQTDVEGSGASSLVVGNLSDDNGDGLIDERDVPEVLLLLFNGSSNEGVRLLALHGDGSGVHFESNLDFPDCAGLAIADVNRDGLPEVVGVANDVGSKVVVALSHAGELLWQSEWFYDDWLPDGFYLPTPVVADLDADGSIEVVTNFGIFRGSDGATLVSLVADHLDAWWVPIVADLDRDGTSEVILGDKVYSHEGDIEWTMGDCCSGPRVSLLSAVADLDGDSEGEVVSVTGKSLYIFDHDGTILVEEEAVFDYDARGPCIADFDADGLPEIAVPTQGGVVMMDRTGVTLWTRASHADWSGLAHCSGFDFDLDGAYEIVLAGEQDMRILDGRTGAIRFEWSSHSSPTGLEYPEIADVDGDGSAEIVFVCAEGSIPPDVATS